MVASVLQRQSAHRQGSWLTAFGWCEYSYTSFLKGGVCHLSLVSGLRNGTEKQWFFSIGVVAGVLKGGTENGTYVGCLQRQVVIICFGLYILQFSRKRETSRSCWLGCYRCCELFQDSWIWRTSQCFSRTGKSARKHFATIFSHCTFLPCTQWYPAKWENPT